MSTLPQAPEAIPPGAHAAPIGSAPAMSPSCAGGPDEAGDAAATHGAGQGQQRRDRVRGAPLRDVVADGVQRWFQETLREAQRGDVKQQALLGEMLQEGYGCEPDPEAGRAWSDKARKRGYRMKRVYCEL